MADIIFDPFDVTFRANPYPFYQRLRETEPIHWSSLGFWLIARFDDAITVLRDQRFGYSDEPLPKNANVLLEQRQLDPLKYIYGHWLPNKNPPDHTRLRSLFNKAFTPTVVKKMGPKIQHIVHRLIDEVQPSGRMDIIADLAYPLPVTIIAELVGVPFDDHKILQPWITDLIGIIEVAPQEEQIKRGNKAITELIDYFRKLVTRRRLRPEDDLISAFIAVEEQEQRLTADEIVTNILLLFVAGHETTRNLIGNGMLALIQYPDQFARLRDDPNLITSAVEEFLRYDSPVAFIPRTALEDVNISGMSICQGQELFIAVGAANRDPQQFSEPDKLDITRNNDRHLSFGYGIHYCLGAPLGRLESQIAINSLVQRLKNLELASDSLVWQDNLIVRGLKSLPVVFEV